MIRIAAWTRSVRWSVLARALGNDPILVEQTRQQLLWRFNRHPQAIWWIAHQDQLVEADSLLGHPWQQQESQALTFLVTARRRQHQAMAQRGRKGAQRKWGTPDARVQATTALRSEASRQKMRDAAIRRFADPEQRARALDSVHSEASRQKRRAAAQSWWRDPTIRAKRIASMHTPAARHKRQQTAVARLEQHQEQE